MGKSNGYVFYDRYLISGLLEWMRDRRVGIYIQVIHKRMPLMDDDPMAHCVDDEGLVVLDLGELAAGDLRVGKHGVYCTVAFSGRPVKLAIPFYAISAIYNPDTSKGVETYHIETLKKSILTVSAAQEIQKQWK